MEANGLESLLSNFTSDTDVHARTQALSAISCKPALDVYTKDRLIKTLCVLDF